MTGVEDEIIADLQDDIQIVEEQLKIEKKVMERYLDMVEGERGRWGEELKKAQIIIRENEREIAKLERKLGKVKPKYLSQVKAIEELERENQMLHEEVETTCKEQEEKINVVRLELEMLEAELYKEQEKLEREQEVNKWTGVFHDKTIATLQKEAGIAMETEMVKLKERLNEERLAYREKVTELEKVTLKRERDELVYLMETLFEVTDECEELERKNKELEEGILKLEEPIEFD